MIIQSSNIDMSSIAKAYRTTDQIQHSESQAILAPKEGAIPKRLVFEHQEAFHYQQEYTNKFQSRSIVSKEGEQQAEYQQNKIASKAIEMSLYGEQALVANQQVFAAADSPSVAVTGEMEMQITNSLFLHESQKTAMSAQGKISLADGRQIDFSLFTSHQSELEISAESKSSLSLQAFADPLVINFGTDEVMLSNQYFQFDLQSNGSEESFAQLGHGSGYLMLDLNGDGKVTNGSELFGTESGNGFSDLAKYDEDGNGWIDENDSVFSKLSLWVDQSSQQGFVSLAEKGVGAIYLGNVEQDKSLRSEVGENLGRVRSAGMVLMESGEVKSAQSIDLAALNTEMPDKDDSTQLAMQEMAQGYNQNVQMSINMMDAINLQTRPFQGVEEARENTKNFFEALQEKINKMLEDRKAILEKIKTRYAI